MRALYEAKARLMRKRALPAAEALRATAVVRGECARAGGTTGPACCRVHVPNGVSV